MEWDGELTARVESARADLREAEREHERAEAAWQQETRDARQRLETGLEAGKSEATERCREAEQTHEQMRSNGQRQLDETKANWSQNSSDAQRLANKLEGKQRELDYQLQEANKELATFTAELERDVDILLAQAEREWMGPINEAVRELEHWQADFAERSRQHGELKRDMDSTRPEHFGGDGDQRLREWENYLRLRRSELDQVQSLLKNAEQEARRAEKRIESEQRKLRDKLAGAQRDLEARARDKLEQKKNQLYDRYVRPQEEAIAQISGQLQQAQQNAADWEAQIAELRASIDVQLEEQVNAVRSARAALDEWRQVHVDDSQVLADELVVAAGEQLAQTQARRDEATTQLRDLEQQAAEAAEATPLEPIVGPDDWQARERGDWQEWDEETHGPTSADKPVLVDVDG